MSEGNQVVKWVFQVIDRRGDVHLITAARSFEGGAQSVILTDGAGEVMARFDSPVAVMRQDAAKSISPRVHEREVGMAVLEAPDRSLAPVHWLVGVSVAAIAVVNVCKALGLIG